MKAARSWGVPLSVMRGERTPTDRWTMKDRAVAVALLDYEAGLCSGCGQPMSECHDADNAKAYEVLPPVRCHACTALAATHEGINADNTKHPDALRWVVRLKERLSPGRNAP